MADVTLRRVIKRYEDVEAVRGIDLDIADKEFVVLVGPSGCGKSTTLRRIEGVEDVSEGDVLIAGEDVVDVPPKDRDIAMVFQNYALYPHMTVYENMSFGLRLKRFARDEIERRVQNAARILDITELLERKPRQLSGGQRQRVAMGRAIVRDPKVFLFDEPLSNLDAQLRVQMRTEIKKVHQKVRTTTIYVTHDQVEAMTLADRVVVMHHGLIEQVGTPAQLYHSPATRFVAGFIGSPAMNLLPCALEEAAGGLRLRLSDTIAFALPAERDARYRPHAGKPGLILGLRPEHITEPRPPLRPAQRSFEVAVDVCEPLGMETLLHFTLQGIDVCARVDPAAGAPAGSRVTLVADLNHMHPPVERRRAHRGEQAARAAFEFVERGHDIERRNLLAVAQELRCHAAHRSAHADHRIERVQARAGEAAAGRLALERAPATGHAVRVLVAVVALDVEHAAEPPVVHHLPQRPHRRPEAPVLPDHELDASLVAGLDHGARI